uniref:Uncharacterized protein n=1 Tax=Rhizophora mucronata TaxID=61149 RepID=A0A2P2NMK6_RHIMU
MITNPFQANSRVASITPHHCGSPLETRNAPSKIQT